MIAKTFAPAIGAVLLVAGCENPESQCREGVNAMKDELAGVVGSSGNISRHAPAVRADTHLDMAQTALVTGNFEGCLEHLGAAREALGE